MVGRRTSCPQRLSFTIAYLRWKREQALEAASHERQHERVRMRKPSGSFSPTGTKQQLEQPRVLRSAAANTTPSRANEGMRSKSHGRAHTCSPHPTTRLPSARSPELVSTRCSGSEKQVKVSALVIPWRPPCKDIAGRLTQRRARLVCVEVSLNILDVLHCLRPVRQSAVAWAQIQPLPR